MTDSAKYSPDQLLYLRSRALLPSLTIRRHVRQLGLERLRPRGCRAGKRKHAHAGSADRCATCTSSSTVHRGRYVILSPQQFLLSGCHRRPLPTLRPVGNGAAIITTRRPLRPPFRRSPSAVRKRSLFVVPVTPDATSTLSETRVRPADVQMLVSDTPTVVTPTSTSQNSSHLVPETPTESLARSRELLHGAQSSVPDTPTVDASPPSLPATTSSSPCSVSTTSAVADSSLHESTALSWCPSSASPSSVSSSPPLQTSANDDTVNSSRRSHRPPRRNVVPVPSAGRHSTCSSTAPLTFGLLNICSLRNKIDGIRGLFDEYKIDVFSLTETWHEDTDSVPIRRLRSCGYQVLEEARPIPAGSNTSSGSFINHGGLALVARAGVQLSRLRLPFSPSSFECDCVRVSSGGASYVLLTLYRPGSDHVSSVFFDELGCILESIVALSTPIVLAGDVNVRLDRPTDSAAKRFTDLLDSLEMTQHMTRATHMHDGILDVIVTRSDDSPSSLSVTKVGLSDHYLVTWSLNVRRTSVPAYVTCLLYTSPSPRD